MSKKCKKCGDDKPLKDFQKNKECKDGHVGKCKICSYEYLKEWRSNNPEKQKEINKRYRENNPEKIKKRNDDSKEYRSEWNKNWYTNNKEDKLEKSKEWYNNNKERKSITSKKWMVCNRDKFNEYRAKWARDKRKNDPLFKISENIRRNIRQSFSDKKFRKESKTTNILGCSFEEFKMHLESKFETWMSWENYGIYNGELNHGWDIDHIIPINSSKTKEDIIKLNNFKNLQPLCSKINRDIKKDKLGWLN